MLSYTQTYNFNNVANENKKISRVFLLTVSVNLYLKCKIKIKQNKNYERKK